MGGHRSTQDHRWRYWSNYRIATSTVWLVSSLRPTIWGWYAVALSISVPSFSNTARQNLDRNRELRSDIHAAGRFQFMIDEVLKPNGCPFFSKPCLFPRCEQDLLGVFAGRSHQRVETISCGRQLHDEIAGLGMIDGGRGDDRVELTVWLMVDVAINATVRAVSDVLLNSLSSVLCRPMSLSDRMFACSLSDGSCRERLRWPLSPGISALSLKLEVQSQWKILIQSEINRYKVEAYGTSNPTQLIVIKWVIPSQ